MLKGAPAGWLIHLGVLAGLAVIGVAATILDRGSSPGGWISLRGVVAMMVWIALGIYAIAATLTFAFLRGRLGLVPSYLVALPLAALFIGGIWWLRNESDRRWIRSQDEAVLRDLGTRFELLGWSSTIPAPGRLEIRAEIRARRAIEVRFDAVDGPERRAALEADPPSSARRSLAAGESGSFSCTLDRAADSPPAEIELVFRTWAGEAGGAGTVTYLPDFPYDAVAGDGQLWRPRPPARP